MEWRPIAEAPRDGRRLIVSERGVWTVARWAEKFSEEHYGDPSPGWYNVELDRRCEPTLWFEPSPPSDWIPGGMVVPDRLEE